MVQVEADLDQCWSRVFKNGMHFSLAPESGSFLRRGCPPQFGQECDGHIGGRKVRIEAVSHRLQVLRLTPSVARHPPTGCDEAVNRLQNPGALIRQRRRDALKIFQGWSFKRATDGRPVS